MRPGTANALLLTASVLFALLVAEFTLRWVRPQLFEVSPQGLFVADPDVGYVLAPGFDGWLRRAEFRMRVRVGASGLRGHDPRPHRSNTVRIVCLGDSFTWGFGVGDDQAYPAQLEKLLAHRHPELDVQVLNAGVFGYGTSEELEFLKTRGALLDPDLVIVQFLPENDFTENRTPARARLDVREGRLVTRPGFAPEASTFIFWRALDWIKNHSHLAYLFSNRLGYLAMRSGLVGGLERFAGDDFSAEDARRATDLLVQIAQEAERLGARSLFLFTSGQMPVISDTDRPLQAPAVVEAAAKRAKVPWIDVTSIFRRRADRLDLYYVADGHWAPRGHRAAAEILANRIIELGLLRPRSAERE
jgi:lysophospholipase L1-like esterase